MEKVADKDFSKKSLVNANILVDKSSKTLNNNGVHGGTPRRNPPLSNTFVTHLKFAGEQLDVPEHCWQNILRTEETKNSIYDGRSIINTP